MPEFTLRAIIMGVLFGILFGAASVYLALKAGLTVSASIPIAVLAISLGKRFFNTTILENNIIQTAGSAGESVASGVVFSLPGLLFLTMGDNGESCGAPFMSFGSLFVVALFGGAMGTLMMVPLRRTLIVKEHDTLPFPEGTACASVLVAGDKGGDFARNAYLGVGVAFAYAFLQKVLCFIEGIPTHVTSFRNKYFPAATINAEITPEYLGIGYIIGPGISGVMLAGGVLAWLGLIPLLATLVPMDVIATQLVKLGELPDLMTAGGPGGWDPATHTFANVPIAIYKAYVRQIGAGAVACAGFLTLIKTFPVIVSSFASSLKGFTDKTSTAQVKRTDRDLSIVFVAAGCLILAFIMCFLPMLPGEGLAHRAMVAVLVLLFGFFFVTVSSRIVGLIGSSSNPVSGMTIATIMGTCLVFIGIKWTGLVFEPMALVVGGMICLITANSGVATQNMKAGYIVGATPRLQQLAFLIGIVTAAAVAAITMNVLDKPTAEMAAQGVTHAIGSSAFPAPQGTLMATLIKGLLAFSLDWQYVIVGAMIAITVELCKVNSLSFAVGAYLPLSTTLPIFAGGVVRWLVDHRKPHEEASVSDDLGSGNLFATGLIAGGSLAGVAVALLSVNESISAAMQSCSVRNALESAFGGGGYSILGVACFAALAFTLYSFGMRPSLADVSIAQKTAPNATVTASSAKATEPVAEVT